MTRTSTHQPGDEITINGVTVILTARKGFRAGSATRYGWDIPSLDYGSESTYATIDEAVADLYRHLDTPCGTCGDPATMTASTGPACTAHYDHMAG